MKALLLGGRAGRRILRLWWDLCLEGDIGLVAARRLQI
jgi:hypothetical protein